MTHRPTPRTRHRAHAGAAATLALIVSLLAPATAAHADTATFEDVGGPGRGVDILRVQVVNGTKVVVRTQHVDLRPAASAGIGIYLDTTTRRRGPEYLLQGLLTASRDWRITTVRNWQERKLLDCPVDLRVNHLREIAAGVIDRDCLGGYAGRIRVTVAASTRRDVDWAPGGRRQFTPWVRR